MLSSNSTFVRTEIPVQENAIKSLIFRVAELLLVFAIWKIFSLLAAAQNLFTSFLLFAEAPIQKAHFVLSRGLSKDAVLVATFTFIYAASQLFATVLWALDAPGHVVSTHQITASSVSTPFLDNPDYMVAFKVTPTSLDLTDGELAERMSMNLFRPGANVSLSELFDQGSPESIPPPRAGGGPRIWLDSEGWSVSTDTFFHVVVNFGASDALTRQLDCANVDIGRSRYYNCTFDNEWVPDLLQQTVGVPMVHYNEKADSGGRMGWVRPANDDIWATIGKSSAPALRIHMFTVTKGLRRHTFVSTIVKSTIVSTEGPVPEKEMRALLERISVPRPGEEAAVQQGITAVLTTMTTAQKNNQSAVVGWVLGDENPHQLIEGFWELLSIDSTPQQPFIGAFRFTSVNITHLRSETIGMSPVPFEPCVHAYQNKAFGGKVTTTDCIGAANLSPDDVSYFGQVDTSAALNLDGFGHPPYPTSDAALNATLWGWVEQNTEKLTNLVLSRGYALGLDPSLVTVEVTAATPGISYLQLFLVLLAGVTALVSWACSWLFTSGHWSSSFLVNILTTTGVVAGNGTRDRRVFCPVPNIYLDKRDGNVELRTDVGVFAHRIDAMEQREDERGLKGEPVVVSRQLDTRLP
ncbi:hypothetical protein QBC39DRAFT_354273 [Podospora conica]|nr:hypothetical protein QBC39DRAFT_354273 [Schizothecium conicum]